jgi:shikimate dehydrogenase
MSVVPWGELAATALAYDVVYSPRVTPFLRAAEQRGLRHEGGLGMLVRQAELSFELWNGVVPPEGTMRAAAEQALDSAGSRA